MTTYCTVSINGLDIFYGEAGSRDRRFLTTHVAENTMLEGVMHFANSTVQIA